MLAPLGFLFLQGKAGASRNAYKGATRAMLSELSRLLREQCEALKRSG